MVAQLLASSLEVPAAGGMAVPFGSLCSVAGFACVVVALLAGEGMRWAHARLLRQATGVAGTMLLLGGVLLSWSAP